MPHRVVTPFVTKINGVLQTYQGGRVVDDDDPGLKGHEVFFEPLEAYLARGVEQATAAPGEKRTLSGHAAKRGESKRG